MTQGLQGRIALVTGGSRGAGRAIALGLAADGADVAVNYRKDDAAAAEPVAAIEALGRRAIAVQPSVAHAAAAPALVEPVTGDVGPLSLLVSNPCTPTLGRPVAATHPHARPTLPPTPPP